MVVESCLQSEVDRKVYLRFHSGSSNIASIMSAYNIVFLHRKGGNRNDYVRQLSCYYFCYNSVELCLVIVTCRVGMLSYLEDKLYFYSLLTFFCKFV